MRGRTNEANTRELSGGRELGSRQEAKLGEFGHAQQIWQERSSCPEKI